MKVEKQWLRSMSPPHSTSPGHPVRTMILESLLPAQPSLKFQFHILSSSPVTSTWKSHKSLTLRNTEVTFLHPSSLLPCNPDHSSWVLYLGIRCQCFPSQWHEKPQTSLRMLIKTQDGFPSFYLLGNSCAFPSVLLLPPWFRPLPSFSWMPVPALYSPCLYSGVLRSSLHMVLH